MVGKRKYDNSMKTPVDAMTRQVQEAADFLATRTRIKPRIGMILGTGLGGLTDNMSSAVRVPYPLIPHFAVSTIQGHRGNLVIGKLGRRPVVAMDGRFHIYEGYSPKEITFPIRLMAKMGVTVMLISSAAGGLNPLFHPGELMIVTDHINLTGMNPLIGPNMESFGPRFPDMSRAYDKSLITLATQNALRLKMELRQGVYAGVLGPSLETPAETRFLRIAGADAVGMSTVLEVIAAIHCGMRVMAIVAITNVNLPDCMERISFKEVVGRGRKAGVSLGRLWLSIVSSLKI